jgi:hypothetical protein
LKTDFCWLGVKTGDFEAYFEGVKSVEKRRFCPLIFAIFFPRLGKKIFSQGKQKFPLEGAEKDRVTVTK